MKRYRDNKWMILTGTIGVENAYTSTYDFMRLTVGYDMQAFFQRNTARIKGELDSVLAKLLSTTT